MGKAVEHGQYRLANKKMKSRITQKMGSVQFWINKTMTKDEPMTKYIRNHNSNTKSGKTNTWMTTSININQLNLEVLTTQKTFNDINQELYWNWNYDWNWTMSETITDSELYWNYDYNWTILITYAVGSFSLSVSNITRIEASSVDPSLSNSSIYKRPQKRCYVSSVIFTLLSAHHW